MSSPQQAIVDTMVAALKDVCKGELHKREATLFENKVLPSVLCVTLCYKNAPCLPSLNKIEGATGATLKMYRLQDKNSISFLIALDYELSETELAAIKEDNMYTDLRWYLLDPFDAVKNEIAELEGSLEKCKKIAASEPDLVERLGIIESSSANFKSAMDNFSMFLLNKEHGLL